MKKYRIPFLLPALIAIMVATVLSCKKKSTEEPVDFLTTGNWMPAATEVVYSDNSVQPRDIQNCELDNRFTFSKDSVLSITKGSLRCSESDADESFPYSYDAELQVLTIGDTEYDVLELTASSLVYSISLPTVVQEIKSIRYLYIRP